MSKMIQIDNQTTTLEAFVEHFSLRYVSWGRAAMKKFLQNTPKFFISEFGLSAYTCTVDLLFGVAYFIPWSTSSAFFALQNLLHERAFIVPILFFTTGLLQWTGVCAERLFFAKVATAMGASLWLFLFFVFDWYNVGQGGKGNLSILFGVDLMMVYSYVMLFLRYMAGYRVFYRHESGHDSPTIDP